ncbi:hypothetical protein [Pseudotabrizicola sp. 4114]|uniref:hypothetical protein n=1 Tax=Pseudotabrizicola sp. 4114 TaxID=2817731 RepID=UPI0028672231|nr:hypothetical protein [Pseudorhodobacter sp. 4114]
MTLGASGGLASTHPSGVFFGVNNTTLRPFWNITQLPEAAAFRARVSHVPGNLRVIKKD